MFSEKELNEFVNRMFENAAKNNNQTAKEGVVISISKNECN